MSLVHAFIFATALAYLACAVYTASGRLHLSASLKVEVDKEGEKVNA